MNHVSPIDARKDAVEKHLQTYLVQTYNINRQMIVREAILHTLSEQKIDVAQCILLVAQTIMPEVEDIHKINATHPTILDIIIAVQESCKTTQKLLGGDTINESSPLFIPNNRIKRVPKKIITELD